MQRTIDTARALVLRVDDERRGDGTSAALRALARLTFPGLEPASGYRTGYYRTREGLGLYALHYRRALAMLERDGHAMRVGRGWCITRAGRKLAALAFGEAALARESEPDDDGRRTLVEGGKDGGAL